LSVVVVVVIADREEEREREREREKERETQIIESSSSSSYRDWIDVRADNRRRFYRHRERAEEDGRKKRAKVASSDHRPIVVGVELKSRRHQSAFINKYYGAQSICKKKGGGKRTLVSLSKSFFVHFFL